MENSVESPLKLKIELPYDPEILLLGTPRKVMKTQIGKVTCTPMFPAALFTIARYGSTLSAHQWVSGSRKCDTHTHMHTMECYSAIKKKEILPFATTWVDLEGIMLSEISQAERDKYRMISCGI